MIINAHPGFYRLLWFSDDIAGWGANNMTELTIVAWEFFENRIMIPRTSNLPLDVKTTRFVIREPTGVVNAYDIESMQMMTAPSLYEWLQIAREQLPLWQAAKAMGEAQGCA